MRHEIRSGCPIVRAEEMTLYQHTEIAGNYSYIPFKRCVLWLRESTTQIVIRHDDCIISELSTLCDFYGYLSSLEGAITNQDDVPRITKNCKCGIGDRLSIDLDVTITDQPVLKDVSAEAMREEKERPTWKSRYIGVDDHWFTSDQPLTAEKYSPRPRLESIEVEKREAIYSTRIHALGVVPEDVAAWMKKHREVVDLAKPLATEAR